MAHDVWKQFSVNAKNFVGLDVESAKAKLPANLRPWQGMKPEHLFEIFLELKNSIQFLLDNPDVFKSLPFNIANNLNSQVSNSYTHLNQFIANTAQGQFQNSLSQLVGLRSNMYTNNITKDLEREQSLVNTEIQAAETMGKLKAASDQLDAERLAIEQLKSEVQSLIEPAVSGSLQKTFKDRAASVRKYRYIWLAVIVVFAACTIYSTNVFVEQAMNMLIPVEDTAATQKSKNSDLRLGMLLMIRGGLLIPPTFLLVYAIKNARLERQYEEEYEHKSSVATALPNYAGLIANDDVKNQILSQAADIIFQLPNQKKEKASKGKEVNQGLDAVNEIVENITKIAKSKTD